jgi:hypothetical protein
MGTRGWPAAVVAAAGMLLTPPSLAQTALDERQQHVATIVTGEIEKLTGPAGRNCGIYTLRAVNSHSPVSHRDVSAALRCVLAAQRRGQAAWAIWQVPDVDAILFDGIGASAVSAVHTVTGRGSNADVELTPCLEPRVGRDLAIECANHQPPTAKDVGKALRGLKRDVERTSGFAWADVAPRPPSAGAAAPAETLTAQVTATQRAVHVTGEPHWPRCPHHFDHPLTYRDGWWFCERDAAFIAAVGRVSSVVPWKTRRR